MLARLEHSWARWRACSRFACSVSSVAVNLEIEMRSHQTDSAHSFTRVYHSSRLFLRAPFERTHTLARNRREYSCVWPYAKSLLPQFVLVCPIFSLSLSSYPIACARRPIDWPGGSVPVFSRSPPSGPCNGPRGWDAILLLVNLELGTFDPVPSDRNGMSKFVHQVRWKSGYSICMPFHERFAGWSCCGRATGRRTE